MSGRQLDQWDSTAIFERWDHLDALEQAQGGLTAEQEAERQELGHEYNNRYVELPGPSYVEAELEAEREAELGMEREAER